MKRYDLPLYVLFCLTRNTLSQKNLAKPKKVSSEDKAKQAKGEKCEKKKSKTKQRKMFKENPYHWATLPLNN